ncbi:MAG TPA: PIN domain-containing protein [Candidatus Nanoarchaeia archaeon]|nr:PIN domain-containing protein [Candidatus Nanoarchaeia archaeon]
MDYFLDTYAMIEIVKGSKAYEKFLDNEFITTKYNLAELHYFLLTRFNLKIADFYLKKFAVYAVDFDIDTISRAMVLRKEMRKKLQISYIDCLGYMVAIVNDTKFLTGDSHFKELENVELVK